MRRPPRKTDINRCREALVQGMREAAQHVSPDTVGASLLATIISDVLAAVVTELAACGTTLREPGGEEEIIKATLEPIDNGLRYYIKQYLRQERTAAEGEGE